MPKPCMVRGRSLIGAPTLPSMETISMLAAVNWLFTSWMYGVQVDEDVAEPVLAGAGVEHGDVRSLVRGGRGLDDLVVLGLERAATRG